MYMKTIEEIRRDNLLILIDELKSIQKVATAIGKSHSQVSQWKNASLDQRTQKPRSMDSDSARLLEIKCHKEIGWMDNSHTELTNTVNSVSESKKSYVTESLQEHDEFRRQLLLFYDGMSEAHQEAIVMTAGSLYNLDNPGNKQNQPFSDYVWAGQERRKGVMYGEIHLSGVRQNVHKDNGVPKQADDPDTGRTTTHSKKKTA